MELFPKRGLECSFGKPRWRPSRTILATAFLKYDVIGRISRRVELKFPNLDLNPCVDERNCEHGAVDLPGHHIHINKVQDVTPSSQLPPSPVSPPHCPWPPLYPLMVYPRPMRYAPRTPKLLTSSKRMLQKQKYPFTPFTPIRRPQKRLQWPDKLRRN
jgi:hypothetical protein